MQRERYITFTNEEGNVYNFSSIGPNGIIEKAIQFIPIANKLFNLVLGDRDRHTGELRDDVRTNNGDRDNILATVAYSVVDFLSCHSGCIVYAAGNTQARTRLYQMSIANNLKEITPILHIEGFANGHWEPFRIGISYEAFIAKSNPKL